MAHEAGRELDAAIAREVFGRRVSEEPNSYREPTWYMRELRQRKRVGPRVLLPHYSTNIAAAWHVFIWLTETTGRCVIIADMEEWDADNAVIVRCGLDEDHDITSYWHPAPLALCLAAIDYLDRKAKGGR